MLRIAWTREEYIILLEVYFRLQPNQFTPDNSQIMEVSSLLRAINQDAAALEPKFRNPNGVAIYARRYLAMDDDREELGLEDAPSLMREIFDEFRHDRQRLTAEAAAIRARHLARDGSGTPPSTSTQPQPERKKTGWRQWLKTLLHTLADRL